MTRALTLVCLSLVLIAAPVWAQQDASDPIDALLAEADRAYEAGDREAEIAALTDLLRHSLSPRETFEVKLMIGSAYTALGQRDNAARAYEDALATNVATPTQIDDLSTFIGVAALEAGDQQRVTAVIDGALERKSPPDPGLILWLVNELAREGREAEAFEYVMLLASRDWYPELPAWRYHEVIATLADSLGERDALLHLARKVRDKEIVAPDGHAMPIYRSFHYGYPDGAVWREIVGECEVTFDISDLGQPFNIQTECELKFSSGRELPKYSHHYDSFEEISDKTIAQWIYWPKIENGEAVVREGVQTTLTYQIAD